MDFAELVDRGARAANLNDYQLSAAIGLLGGKRVFSPKQVHRVRTGQQRHYDQELIARLIEVLALDPDEAWQAAGLWPPDLSVEDVRRFRQAAALQPTGTTGRYRAVNTRQRALALVTATGAEPAGQAA